MSVFLRKPILCLISAITLLISGCGYSHSWMYPKTVSTVYVEMFDSRSFRRGHEYNLTDAIAKRIESETPYKIVSDRNLADSVISGQITAIGQGTLSYERESGSAFERDARVMINFSWKDLKTGQLFVDNENVEASATFSSFVGQDFDYAARVAINRAAVRVVERMQTKWEPEEKSNVNN
ncbi:MAG: hypothetical protein FVQ79_00935 [Planctomycetes bacterium]|nr:hypothetical protein [Planctomycetota bacterium]